MSDSLREQMLKAGFKQTAKPEKKPKPARPKQNKKNSARHNNQSKNATGPSSMERANIAEREAIAERKRIKAEIKTIIEAEKVEKTTGETAHSYLVGKRIKQMFVTDEIQAKLVSGELVITRLNGSTFLIPSETGDRVHALNPDWVVIVPGVENAGDTDDEYADFKVPDDLKW